ncbi:MAG: 4-hydroxy-tetrahydrodipicolinate reductase [Actinobacteria bacterium]|jgi:4-hydroxy-tetrahydrodipicolinate reductase|nr:4-hydroxy-tetrahydrodipicolinate reductase [Actinomycetota bacterium]
MGQAVVEAVNGAADCELVAAIDMGVPPSALLQAGAEVIVDFTTPDAVMRTLKSCIGNGIHCVIGTTGFDEGKLAKVAEWCDAQPSVGVLIAPNFGIGAVLMMRLAELAAPYFESAEIIELHHPDKVDAPSGTAAHTAHLMAAARSGLPPQQDATIHEMPGARGTTIEGIHVHSVRARGLVAHQEVILGGEGETLTIRHDSLDRRSFMPGVLLGVRRVSAHPGLTIGLAGYLDLGT